MNKIAQEAKILIESDRYAAIETAIRQELDATAAKERAKRETEFLKRAPENVRFFIKQLLHLSRGETEFYVKARKNDQLGTEGYKQKMDIYQRHEEALFKTINERLEALK